MISLKNVLVATDFGQASDAALVYGRSLAHTFGATLHVLHVTETVAFSAFGAESYVSIAPDMQRDIDAAARTRLHGLLLDSDNNDPRTITALKTSNAPALSIVEYAKDKSIDLIVMGTHGRGALA